jgi:hypothetical protein
MFYQYFLEHDDARDYDCDYASGRVNDCVSDGRVTCFFVKLNNKN